jgi:hypothetical protein
MSNRAERREEIKLILEYVKVAFSLIGVATVLFALLQWRLANLTATETGYQRMTNEWRDHLKTFVEKPALRPFFEERKQLASDDKDTQAVLALADVRLDTADAILTYAAFHGASNEIGGWKNTFSRAFRASPVLCTRLNETRDNYGLILDVAKEACASAKRP